MRSVIIAAAALIILTAAAIPGTALLAYDSGTSAGDITIATTTDISTQQRSGEAELPWLFAVYAITWAAFFGYVFVMSRRQREMQREIETLKRALEAKED
ncbi:MAG: CcmD family protein [Chloroflexi bacterium]|nr:CcmD family protein [Chloroflexota bacterium]